MLSGGMDECFEIEFSQKTQDFIKEYEPFWNPEPVQASQDTAQSHKSLLDLI